MRLPHAPCHCRPAPSIIAPSLGPAANSAHLPERAGLVRGSSSPPSVVVSVRRRFAARPRPHDSARRETAQSVRPAYCMLYVYVRCRRRTSLCRQEHCM